MKLHNLKIKEEYFEAILQGRKTFELRKNDRDYQVGDLIHFVKVSNQQLWNGPAPLIDYETYKIAAKQVIREFEENPNNLFEITYILKNVEQYGLDKDYCILGIKKLEINEK